MSTSPFVPATDRWGDRLPRRLGFWSAVAVLVGSTIGGGIFRTPAVIAERVPAPLPMFSVWVLGGLLALCGALTYARDRKSTRLNSSHGYISYAVFCLQKKSTRQSTLQSAL